jgi:hypothetical protein
MKCKNCGEQIKWYREFLEDRPILEGANIWVHTKTGMDLCHPGLFAEPEQTGVEVDGDLQTLQTMVGGAQVGRGGWSRGHLALYRIVIRLADKVGLD